MGHSYFFIFMLKRVFKTYSDYLDYLGMAFNFVIENGIGSIFSSPLLWYKTSQSSLASSFSINRDDLWVAKFWF